jgi:hypothetical protein
LLDPTSVNEAGAETHLVYLGSVVPDLGMWTDWIFHWRMNPFSVPTTVTGVGSFPGNTGILEAWKCSGPPDGNGDRAIDINSPIFSRVNLPIGLRPQASKLQISTRAYEFGLRDGIISSGLTHPRRYFFDEIRWGFAGTHAAQQPDGDMRFSDVLPRTAG